MSSPESEDPRFEVNWQLARDCAAMVAKSHHGLPFRIVRVESTLGHESAVIRVTSATEMEES